jgi:hypothetical protein
MYLKNSGITPKEWVFPAGAPIGMTEHVDTLKRTSLEAYLLANDVTVYESWVLE